MPWLLLPFPHPEFVASCTRSGHLAVDRLPLLPAIVGPRPCHDVGQQVVETLKPTLPAHIWMVTPMPTPTSTSVGASTPSAIRATPTSATSPAATHLPVLRQRPLGTSVYRIATARRQGSRPPPPASPSRPSWFAGPPPRAVAAARSLPPGRTPGRSPEARPAATPADDASAAGPAMPATARIPARSESTMNRRTPSPARAPPD